MERAARRESPPAILRRLSPVTAAVSIVVIVWSVQLASGVVNGRTAVALSYAAWAVSAGRVPGIDAYLSAHARAIGNRLLGPAIFKTDGPLVTYPHERNIFRIHARDNDQPPRIPDTVRLSYFTIDGFAKFIDAVRRQIPAGEGLFVPPYLAFFRDALPDHRIFFQEHYDGNLMLGAPRFTEFWRRRMDDLLGFSYEGMPSKYSGLSFTQIRSAYLGIDGPHVEKLKARYPSFRYFVTEKAHAIPYKAAFESSGLVAYDLERPIRRG